MNAHPIPIPVLLYHAVDDDPPDWIAPYTHSRAAFRRHLDEIEASGRTVVPLEQFVAAVRGGPSLPENALVLTFDDGFADFHRFVAPELAARGLPSTLYVTTGALDLAGGTVLPSARMLSWSETVELDRAGVQIGSHSVTHPQMDVIGARAARAEIEVSKMRLEDKLGHAVTAFAYPHGYSTGSVRRLVREAGYTSATAVLNAFSSTADDPYRLARLMVMADITPARFTRWLGGTGADTAPFREHLYAKSYRAYRRGRVALAPLLRRLVPAGGS